ncbi:MAG: bifunctional precorrin-2 dehydrogenase/sirohydrochlorin ferrochelatase [archaeon]|nr:bifunctional precorrin-2 dehydrogenase/sirohydrochlorin ferrochelatase [archaeon]
MNWTSLYLKSNNLNVFILGTGEVATRRANRFLDYGSQVVLAGNSISDELINKGANLISTEDAEKYISWADLVVIASSDKELSDKIASLAQDKLVNRADFPEKGDIIVPTSFEIGDVEISIFTNGKSPLMARELRKKIQSIITEEDILEIKIQDFARNLLKEKVSNQKTRKEILYDISKDAKINNYIKNNQIKEAKKYVEEIINAY